MDDGPTGARAAVELNGLRRTFDGVTAVDGVDLTVDEPEIVGVAGPNGSGKTTLLRCLLGLLAPTDGEAQVNGVPATQFGPADRSRLGYMPQRTAVYGELTVRQNVDFFARLYRVDDRAAAVRRALEFVDLRDREDHRIGALSGGMVRRTSLACALVHDPSVLVLDEPTVGLDPELRTTMWDGFRERRDRGAVVFVSTHYLGEAERCDRVVLLRDGRVLAAEPPARLRERTGTADLEAAFLALLDRAEGATVDVDTGSGGDGVGE